MAKRTKNPFTRSLLSIGADAKTVKGEKVGFMTGILYLLPAMVAGTGQNMCQFAGDCALLCLAFAGRAMGMSSIGEARKRKTVYFVEHRETFLAHVADSVGKLVRKAERKGMVPVVRLNGTSDRFDLVRPILDMYPNTQCYDYTKLPKPWLRVRSNYHLTFSYDTYFGGRADNWQHCLDALSHGINVAVPFNVKKGKPLPETFRGFPVIDGDESDLRFLDPVGVVVGLRLKVTKASKTGKVAGFVVTEGAWS